MKNIIKRIAAVLMLAAFIFCTYAEPISADAPVESDIFVATAEKPFRREVSPEKPMWIVHIDSWVNADPEKLIDAIPEDLLPYVVFNISMSISWDENQQRFTRVEYGYELAKSWLRACAEKGVWAMIQPASGGPCHFPDYNPAEIDYDDTLFGEFFREYPNFLGYNYCEQFWGFDNYVKGFSVTAEERYIHFAGLLELCNKYGGYLVDSWCGNEWGQSINPLAMIKRIPEFEEAARKYSDNFILLEKYTQVGYQSDMESLVLGTYLSGYCGNFGIRYDDTGWTDESGEGTGGYVLATGLTIHFERMALNGMTVMDGPELTWVDDILETKPEVDKKGYTIRKWEATQQFTNVWEDMFRKVVDGDFRIPTREEVIARTKLIIVNDVETGKDDDKYCTPQDLYDGLYKMENDGYLKDNRSFYKSSGRYPTIPTTAGFADSKYEKLFERVIYKSEYKSLWPTIDDKVADLDSMFEEQYTGDAYAGRYENTWVTYNPYKRNQTAKSTIQLKYNTAESIGVSYPRYSTGLIREYSDHIDLYLNNFNEDSPIQLRDDVITINGATEKPSFEMIDRGIGIVAAKATEEWSNGVYTLTVSHNGPVGITIKCSGSGTGRLTDYTDAKLVEPDAPPVYHGTLQHEGELFDTLGVEQVVVNGVNGNVRNYYGQGYLIMGMNKDARARDTVTAVEAGKYALSLRYRAGGGNVAIYVNGSKTNVELNNTNGEWETVPIIVRLKKGENIVEIRMTDDLGTKLYVDCITLDLMEAGGGGGSVVAIVIAAAVVVIAAVAVVLALTKKKKKA